MLQVRNRGNAILGANFSDEKWWKKQHSSKKDRKRNKSERETWSLKLRF